MPQVAEGKTLRHWNPVDGKLVRAHSLGTADIVTAVTVTSDGTKAISSRRAADKTVRTWNTSDGAAGRDDSRLRHASAQGSSPRERSFVAWSVMPTIFPSMYGI